MLDLHRSSPQTDEERRRIIHAVVCDHQDALEFLAPYDGAPPQTTIPDDLVPNAAGYSNDQLAIRILAEVVAQLAHEIVHLSGVSAATRHLDALAEVLRLTEPT